jgi:hypothetical protein
MSKNKGRHLPHDNDHDPSDEHGYRAEAAREQSRQNAMAAREKASRTKLISAQNSVKRGNQPRHG